MCSENSFSIYLTFLFQEKMILRKAVIWESDESQESQNELKNSSQWKHICIIIKLNFLFFPLSYFIFPYNFQLQTTSLLSINLFSSFFLPFLHFFPFLFFTILPSLLFHSFPFLSFFAFSFLSFSFFLWFSLFFLLFLDFYLAYPRKVNDKR